MTKYKTIITFFSQGLVIATRHCVGRLLRLNLLHFSVKRFVASLSYYGAPSFLSKPPVRRSLSFCETQAELTSRLRIPV